MPGTFVFNQFILPNCFFLYHLVLPLIVFILIAAVLELTAFDVWLAGYFYDRPHGVWPYREHWLIQDVLHKGGRYLIYGVGVTLLGLMLGSFRAGSPLLACRQPLAYLSLAGIAGPLIITYLKSRTHIYCPWDLVQFNGNKPYVRLLEPVAGNLTVGHCFPSGHSALGFTFVNIYFFFLLVNPANKYAGLMTGLLLGLLFGVAQQARGAHFFSHNLFSLAICWLSSLLIFMVFYGISRRIRSRRLIIRLNIENNENGGNLTCLYSIVSI